MRTQITDPVERELLAAAYENLNSILAMSVIAGVGGAVVMMREDLFWAWPWAAAITGVAICRRLAARHVDRAKILAASEAQLKAWHLYYAAGLYLSALLWIAPTAFLPAGAAAAKFTFAIMLSALAAGGTGVLAARRYDGRIYIAAMLGPTATLLFAGTPNGLVLTTLGIVFMAVMLVVHHRNHRVLRRGLALQIENSSLVSDLQRLNENLEYKIAERTEELREAANRDSLTGLPNRRGLMAWTHDAHLCEPGYRAAALFLDLDRFKQINDALGHNAGDRILRMASERLSLLVPENGHLARWGGDEFVMLLSGDEDLQEQANETARGLIEAIARPFSLDDQQVSVGLSVGAAYYPGDADGFEGMILAADLAVAQVKKTGRGRMLDYCESFALSKKRRFDLSRALGAAIESEELEIAFQPIIDAKTGEVYAYEALSRWTDPLLGDVLPDEFIPLAEDSDRIVALGDFVLRRACEEASRWAAKDRWPRLSVNISIRQLREKGFAFRVMQILGQTGLPPNQIDLEVTESLFDDEHRNTAHREVEALRAFGVSISIDDFGTGYSSLSRLQNLPVKLVKIDRSFITDLKGNGSTIVESTLMIARRFGIGVVAEGVESFEQAATLRAMGVDYLQGFYVSRPLKSIRGFHPSDAPASADQRRTADGA